MKTDEVLAWLNDKGKVYSCDFCCTFIATKHVCDCTVRQDAGPANVGRVVARYKVCGKCLLRYSKYGIMSSRGRKL